MKEFKDYPTMLEEKKINAKKKRDEVKRLRDEASFKERQERYKKFEENSEIIENVREHFTAEQIANKEYLQNATQYKLKDIKEIEQEYEDAVIRNSLYVPGVKSRNSDFKNTRYHEDDKIGIIEHKLNLFGTMIDVLKEKLNEFEESKKWAFNGVEMDIDYIKGVVKNMAARLDMLEEKPPYPYSKSFDA